MSGPYRTEPDSPEPTVCAKCVHSENSYDGWVCLAQATVYVDPVTGRRRRRGVRECKCVNSGRCPDYERKRTLRERIYLRVFRGK